MRINYHWHSHSLTIKEIGDICPTLQAGMGMGGAVTTSPILIVEINDENNLCLFGGNDLQMGGQRRVSKELSPPLLAAMTDNMPPTIIIGETDDSDRGKREQTESQRRRSKGE